MNIINLSIIAILAAFSAMPSLAQSIAPVVYENAMLTKPAAREVVVGQASDHEVTAKTLWNAFGVRSNALNMETSRTGMITKDDHISLTTYAPMQAVNGVLSLAGYASRSRLDDSLVTWVQILSLAARRQINTELKYSVKINGYSKFDSFIAYRLNPASDTNKSGMSAGLRYNIRF